MKADMRLRVLGALAVAGALVLSGGPAMAADHGTRTPTGYTCTGGDIPSGHYASIAVTGVCDVPADGRDHSRRAMSTSRPAPCSDAQSAPSTITIGRNVTAGRGSTVGLGCQPPSYTGNSAHECAVEPEGQSTITVNGNVTGIGADAVLLNGVTVRRNVTPWGGGSDIPWSIKNNTIGGNLTASGNDDRRGSACCSDDARWQRDAAAHQGERRGPGGARCLHRPEHRSRGT